MISFVLKLYLTNHGCVLQPFILYVKKKVMHIGRKVAKAREIIGIKQDEMARYFKITQQAYSKWEQGEDIEESTLQKICDKLGVSVDFVKH